MYLKRSQKRVAAHFNILMIFIKDIETETKNLGKNIPEFAIFEIPENFVN